MIMQAGVVGNRLQGHGQFFWPSRSEAGRDDPETGEAETMWGYSAARGWHRAPAVDWGSFEIVTTFGPDSAALRLSLYHSEPEGLYAVDITLGGDRVEEVVLAGLPDLWSFLGAALPMLIASGELDRATDRFRHGTWRE